MSLQKLETIITEIEAMLNDRLLTYVSSDISDPEPLTPAHLIYGRRNQSVPLTLNDLDEPNDPTYLSNVDMRRVDNHSQLIQRFWSRWRKEYVALREFHKINGTNKQSIKKGDTVVVHNDTPRLNWKFTVIEELVKGNDGLIHSVKLYPLEVADNVNVIIQDNHTVWESEKNISQ